MVYYLDTRRGAAAGNQGDGPVDVEPAEKFPRIVIRDPVGIPLDTDTKLQKALYAARWRNENGIPPDNAEQWRLPNGYVPSRPDFSRAPPPLASERMTNKERRRKKKIAGSLPNLLDELEREYNKEVQKISFSLQQLETLPPIVAATLLRQQQSVKPRSKTFMPFVATAPFENKTVSTTDKRDSEYTFPGFCSGCNKSSLCYGCEIDPYNPHYHYDKPMRTGGGFTYFKRDKPQKEKTANNPLYWKVMSDPLMYIFYDKFKDLAKYGISPKVGRIIQDIAKDNIDETDVELYQGQTSIKDQAAYRHLHLSSPTSDGDSGKGATVTDSQDLFGQDVSELGISSNRVSEDRSAENTTRDTEPAKQRPKLYKAPKAFQLKKTERKVTKAEDPFSKDREYNLNLGDGFKIKQSDKPLTEFDEFTQHEGGWQEPKKFELKDREEEEDKLRRPSASDEKGHRSSTSTIGDAPVVPPPSPPSQEHTLPPVGDDTKGRPSTPDSGISSVPPTGRQEELPPITLPTIPPSPMTRTEDLDREYEDTDDEVPKLESVPQMPTIESRAPSAVSEAEPEPEETVKKDDILKLPPINVTLPEATVQPSPLRAVRVPSPIHSTPSVSPTDLALNIEELDDVQIETEEETKEKKIREITKKEKKSLDDVRRPKVKEKAEVEERTPTPEPEVEPTPSPSPTPTEPEVTEPTPPPPKVPTPPPPRKVEPPPLPKAAPPAPPKIPVYVPPEKPTREVSRTMIEQPPPMPEPPKQRAPPPARKPKRKMRERRLPQLTKQSVAPVTKNDLKEISDPLDYLSKYCIIHPDRLPLYERIFNKVIGEQVYRYSDVPMPDGSYITGGKKEDKDKKPAPAQPQGENVAPQKTKLTSHEKKMISDMTVITRATGTEFATAQNKGDQIIAKITYTLDTLMDKYEAMQDRLDDLQGAKIGMVVALAKKQFPEVCKPDYEDPKKKKARKKKEAKKTVADKSTEKMFKETMVQTEKPEKEKGPKRVTDLDIVNRLDEKMMAVIDADPEVHVINVEMDRLDEKLREVDDRIEDLEDEKKIMQLYSRDCFYEDQKKEAKPEPFLRAQSPLYQKMHPRQEPEMNLNELEEALQQINGHLITEKEMQYIFHILYIPGRRRVNVQLFSVIAALSEKVRMVDPLVKKLINKFDFEALDVKVDRSKELFDLLDDEAYVTPDGKVSSRSLGIDLTAGGMTPEHTHFVVDKFNREKKGIVDYLDFLTYVPLFIEIHKRIIADPLSTDRMF